MSAGIVEPTKLPPAARQIFTGRSRWAAAAVLVTGALLQAIEFLLTTNN